MMVVGVYATLGIFLVRAAKDPTANSSLIWFVIISSVVHAGVMTVQAISNPMTREHLIGDVPVPIARRVLGVLSNNAARPEQTAACRTGAPIPDFLATSFDFGRKQMLSYP
jgi:hypothetical protein